MKGNRPFAVSWECCEGGIGPRLDDCGLGCSKGSVAPFTLTDGIRQALYRRGGEVGPVRRVTSHMGDHSPRLDSGRLLQRPARSHQMRRTAERYQHVRVELRAVIVLNRRFGEATTLSEACRVVAAQPGNRERIGRIRQIAIRESPEQTDRRLEYGNRCVTSTEVGSNQCKIADRRDQLEAVARLVATCRKRHSECTIAASQASAASRNHPSRHRSDERFVRFRPAVA